MLGTTFGPYRIEELLGRGGMGEVYRAHDTRTDRTVALKLLPAHLAEDDEYQARFRRECKVAARLNRIGDIDGRLYLDMRLVKGTDLGAWLREHGPMPPDVGTDEVPGTTRYVATERFEGSKGDRRVDVYALACVLHESLTGRPPFDGEFAALVAAHLYASPPRPSVVRPGVPAGFDDVVATGMANSRPTRRCSPRCPPASATSTATPTPRNATTAARCPTSPAEAAGRRPELGRVRPLRVTGAARPRVHPADGERQDHPRAGQHERLPSR